MKRVSSTGSVFDGNEDRSPPHRRPAQGRVVRRGVEVAVQRSSLRGEPVQRFQSGDGLGIGTGNEKAAQVCGLCRQRRGGERGFQNGAGVLDSRDFAPQKSSVRGTRAWSCAGPSPVHRRKRSLHPPRRAGKLAGGPLSVAGIVTAPASAPPTVPVTTRASSSSMRGCLGSTVDGGWPSHAPHPQHVERQVAALVLQAHERPDLGSLLGHGALREQHAFGSITSQCPVC